VDETLRRAFVRSLEIIGEAAKKVPEDVRATHPVVELRAMAGMPDRLIHNYFRVDFELVWDVVQRRVPGAPRADCCHPGRLTSASSGRHQRALPSIRPVERDARDHALSANHQRRIAP
jgi:hypothetical protein